MFVVECDWELPFAIAMRGLEARNYMRLVAWKKGVVRSRGGLHRHSVHISKSYLKIRRSRLDFNKLVIKGESGVFTGVNTDGCCGRWGRLKVLRARVRRCLLGARTSITSYLFLLHLTCTTIRSRNLRACCTSFLLRRCVTPRVPAPLKTLKTATYTFITPSFAATYFFLLYLYSLT